VEEEAHGGSKTSPTVCPSGREDKSKSRELNTKKSPGHVEEDNRNEGADEVFGDDDDEYETDECALQIS
jgi:hypothetical protein